MLVRQSVGSVEFVSSIQDGSIQYASFGGEDYWAKKVEEDSRKVKTFLGSVDLLVLWVCGMCLGGKNAVNDFLGGLVPMVKSRLRQWQGWYNQEEVDNILTDIWLTMSGHKKSRKNKSAPFDPKLGELSTWISNRVRSYTSDKQRQKRLAKKLLGLGMIVDDDTPLSSIGLFGLGLTYEPSDSDQIGNKWVQLSKMDNPTFDRVARLEESRGLQKILARLGQKDREVLEGYFLEGLTFQQLADKCGFANKSGPQKAVLRIVNGLRDHYKRGEEKIVRLGGKKNRNLQFVSVE
jgi:RNA polymerase sigma factor (sigma-70 family)